MSHISIIISKVSVPPNGGEPNEAAAASTTYDYRIPVPHGASPADVAEIVKKAYKRLEPEED